MIDAHLHLQDPRLRADLDDILAVCEEEGIRHQVVNGTCPEDWPEVEALALRYPGRVRACYGLHPWRVQEAPDGWQACLRDYLSREARGLGEVGLDKWIRNHDLEKQRVALTAQMELAVEFGLPLMLHCLQAWGSLLELLKNGPCPAQGFLLHSYGGPPEMIPDFVDLGGYFSFSGHFLSERKRAHLERCLASVPGERLLAETDAPDMALPENLRRHGDAEYNHPANLVVVYEQLAAMSGCDLPQLIAQIGRNMHRFLDVD